MKANSGIFFAAFFVFLFAFSVPGFAQVAESSMAYPYQNPGSTQTTASYSALLDDRGQSTVGLALDYFNYSDLNVDKITLDIPGKSVSVKYALQTNSNNYNYYPEPYYYDAQGIQRPYPTQVGPQWISVEKISSNTFTFTLPTPVERGQSTSVLVYYKVLGYAESGITGIHFDFQTPKFSFDVDSTRVSIGVDQGLILKEGETKADYIQSFGMSEAMVAPSAAKQAIDSGAANQTLSNIRYASGGLVKTKTSLNAGESFHVTGNYAKQWIALYWMEVLAVIIVLAIVVWLLKKWLVPAIGNWSDKTFATTGGKGMKSSNETDFGRAALFGFIASAGYALVTMVVTLATFLIAAALNRGSYYAFERFFGWFLLIEIALGILFLVGVFAITAKKSNLTEAVIACMVFFAVSLILVPIAFAITALIATLIAQSLFQPVYTYPMMGTTVID